MSNKVALITGVTGQDGAYLSEFLLKKGYTVHGIKRRTSLINTKRIDFLYNEYYEKKKQFFLHYGDITDASSIIKIIKKTNPNEIYNLAAMSHVKVSFENPIYTAEVDALGTLKIMEAIRILDLQKKVKIYQASTSEMYGNTDIKPINEKTPFSPKSPYGVAKLFSYWTTKNYRESYNYFACNGILFNHESPLRGETFVTRKITLGIAKIIKGKKEKIVLGNLNARRDWGHAKDYVEMMWMILQHEIADDWIIASGKSYSIRDFIKKAFEVLDIKIEFIGKGVNEHAFVKKINKKRYSIKEGQIVVEVNEKYFRESEIDDLVGDSSKASKILGWKPKTNFTQLVREMVFSDIEYLDNK